MTAVSWESGSTRAARYFSQADAGRARLIAGKRVLVNWWSPTLQGRRGVIVAVGEGEWVGEGDCAVLLDGRDHPFGFYWHELEMLPS